MMRENPFVCVEIDHVDNLANWRSVVAWGQFEELRGTAATAGLAFLRERFKAIIVSQTVHTEAQLAEGEARIHRGNGHAAIYRIHLLEKTGRFERS